MNLYKAEIVNGKRKGNIIWIDEDSKLTQWAGSKRVVTYKAYLIKGASPTFYARFKETSFKKVEENVPEHKVEVGVNITIDDVIAAFADKELFIVVDNESDFHIDKCTTYKKCLEYVKEYREKSEDGYNLEIYFMLMKEAKFLVPSI